MPEVKKEESLKIYAMKCIIFALAFTLITTGILIIISALVSLLI